jgi:hypothetical protein
MKNYACVILIVSAFVIGGILGFLYTNNIIQFLVSGPELRLLSVTDSINLQFRTGAALAICAASPFLSAYLTSKVWLGFWKMLLITNIALLILLIGFTVFARMRVPEYAPIILPGELPVETAWLTPPIVLLIMSILIFFIRYKSARKNNQ